MKYLRMLIALSSVISLVGNAQVVDSNPSRFKFNEAEYNTVNYKLISLLYGASEIGAKSCKPAGKALPGSLDSWFSAIKVYTEGESMRDTILNNRIAILKNKMNQLANSKTKELQIEAIQTQIDLINVSIDSIAGSNYFNDGSAAEVARTGRMPLRENLILAALKSIEKNGEENLKNLTVYDVKLIEKGFVHSLKVAKEACDRKKTVKKCTVTEAKDGTSSESCVETEEKDPVKGCDVALAKIPQIQNVLAKLYADLYLLPRISSRELNLKLGKLEDTMESAIEAIPKSDDAKFDWSTGMISGIKDMRDSRKEAGAICAGSSKESFTQGALDKLLGDTDSSSAGKSNLIPEDFGKLPAASPLDGKKIKESAVKFLVTMGIGTQEKADEAVNPKPLKEGEKPKEKDSIQLAAEGFVEAWNLSDQLIGQAGQRGRYYEEIALTVDELLTMDYLKLSELVRDKAKLEKYLDETKLQLNQMSGGSSSVATTSGGAKAKAARKQNSAGALDVEEVTNKPLNLSAGTNTEGTNKDASVKVASLVSGNNNLLLNNYVSGASAVNISGLSLQGLSAKAIASIGKTNNAISRLDTQVAGLTTKIAPAKKSSVSGGNSLGAALKGPMEKIASGLKGANANLLFANNNSAIGHQDHNSGPSHSDTGLRSQASGVSGATTRSYEVDLGNNSSRGNASAKVASNDSKYPVFPSGKKTSLSGKKGKYSQPEIYGNDPESASNESKLISSVIDARNLKNKEAFAPTEDDSLFERVTKAYIRNYEKVDDVPAVVEEQ